MGELMDWSICLSRAADDVCTCGMRWCADCNGPQDAAERDEAWDLTLHANPSDQHAIVPLIRQSRADDAGSISTIDTARLFSAPTPHHNTLRREAAETTTLGGAL